MSSASFFRIVKLVLCEIREAQNSLDVILKHHEATITQQPTLVGDAEAAQHSTGRPKMRAPILRVMASELMGNSRGTTVIIDTH